jgi:2-dehydro-3-deoxyphosphooctonate aldolase (KDO 8-P synthase)
VSTFWSAPVLIAGPCVLDRPDVNLRIAEGLAKLAERLDLRVVFKGSFDKANRSRRDAPRGPGLEEGLAALEAVRRASGLPVLTDVHEVWQVGPAAEAVDALQIPAFLCRQTDLLVAVGMSGRPVNVKKGQWMAPQEMAGAVEKVRSDGSHSIAVTERGTFFGYGDLVVDMRSFLRLRRVCGTPVLFDATHAVQRPGLGEGGSTAGAREHVPALACAAAAAGADGWFIETHVDPAASPSDAASIWPLAELDGLLERTVAVWHASREPGVPAWSIR